MDKNKYPHFTTLRVYNLSEELANTIWDIVNHWTNFEKDTIGKQIVRAADSIGANIAEGNGRGSFIDNKRFIRISRGSLNETRHFLRCAYSRNLINVEDVNKIQKIITELNPKLNAYLNSIGTKKDKTNNNQLTTIN